MFGSSQQTSPAVHTHAFGFFRAGIPGGGGQVTALVGEQAYNTAAYSLCVALPTDTNSRPIIDCDVRARSSVLLAFCDRRARPYAAIAEAKTRTSVLYSDRNELRVAFQLRDAAGESRVSQQGLIVLLDLSFSDGGDSISVTCGSPSAATGIGECQGTLTASQFGVAPRTGVVRLTVQYGTGTLPVAAALAGSISLQPAIALATLSSVGMIARLPASPRYAGESISVHVYAHTGPENFALKGWSVTFQYDTAMLSLSEQQVAFTSVYQQPTVVHYPETGVYAAVTTGTDPAYSNTDVTSQTSLYIMTLPFQVLAGPASRPALNGTIGAMVNQGTQRYVSDATILFTDIRSGLHDAGYLIIEESRVVGVFAYATSASYVNTAVLDGTAVQGAVQAVELYSQASSPPTVSTQYACTSRNSSIVSVSSAGCSFALTVQQTLGGSVMIYVYDANGTEAAQVPLEVWYPLDVTAHVDDSELDRLQGVEARSSCNAGDLYQETTVTASASFVAAAGQRADGLDVSSLVSFMSTNASVVAVVAARVLGVAPGNGLLHANVAAPAAVSVLGVGVSVTTRLAVVTALRASVVTGVSWTTSTSIVVPWHPSNGSFTAGVQLQQTLSQEGAVGTIVVDAVFDDGAKQAVPP